MLLYVGRVAHEKNIGFLLTVIKKLIQQSPDALLVITGEGPAEVSLHAQTKSLGLENNVQFIGYLDRNTELNACYHAADVFVFASKSETQGLVLLEAMAQSTPVVAIAELGTASILIEGLGALIAPENAQIFADKIHQLLSNPEQRIALGQAGQSYAISQWSASAKADQMVSFYQALIRERLEKQAVKLGVQQV
jgi:glycosyltransferase involved in cell wall biosynthesis